MNWFKRDRAQRRAEQWEEVEEYRALLEAPGQFEEGFTLRTILGVLFISLIMTPGEMYLGLFSGGGVGAAAQWVTVILFLEVAKRSFTSLRRQEIYLLVYVAGALINREEGAFLDLLWRQYLVRSPEAEQFGIARLLPWWWAPSPDSEAIAQRTFFHPDWAVPILLTVLGTIVGRITWFTSGYVLFRLTSDREQLPFPTAPMSALSSMALAEESGQEHETWKWPVFSIGAAIGTAFGVLYVGVPSVTQLWGARVELIPIPFWDLTGYLGNVLKATPLGISLHLGAVFGGLLMPFWGVVGSFAGVMVHSMVSPILYAYGFLPRWEVGMSTIQTEIATAIDFWRAFGIGITLAVTAVSFYLLWAQMREKREEIQSRQVKPLSDIPAGRGDFSLRACMFLFCLAALYPIILAKILFPSLVNTGLILTFMLIGFVYAPLMSTVSARLDGMIGRNVNIPYIHETVIFLTGYRGVDIWFVPFPGQNFGGNAEQFRIVELTGMKFTSLLKAEVFMLPIVFGVSIMYWSFLWRLGPIPSDSYPYAQIMWPRNAFNQALFLSSTMYSKTWRAGEEVEGEVLPHGQAVWSPSNLQDRRWWYWRARVSREVELPDPVKREYGAWSPTGYFFTDFNSEGPPAEGPPAIERLKATGGGDRSAPRLLGPAPGSVVSTPNPHFRATVELASGDTVDFYFELDRLPSFDGEFLQRSTDRPLLFEVLWEDLRFTGDRKDDDGDGRIDEEVVNGLDDDGDGHIDEDFHHPLGGRKWPIIAFGAGFGTLAYFALSALGLPIFLIWGYVGSVLSSPHGLFLPFFGALLARFYFWKKYGKQEWRRYAMVLSVGFGVGTSLIGMFCAALAMISKAVSSLMY